MAELNASILAGGNLGGLALEAQRQADERNKQTFSNINSLVDQLKSSTDTDQYNAVLKKNFNAETQELDQKGVLSDLFNLNPQKALEYQKAKLTEDQTRGKIENERLKTESEISKNNSQGNLFETQAQVKKDEQMLDSLKMGIGMLGQANSQQELQTTINFLKSKGIPGTEVADGMPFSPKNKAYLQGLMLNGAEDLKNQIAMKNANINQQNADTNRMNAESKNTITPFQQQQLSLEQQRVNQSSQPSGQIVDTAEGLQVFNPKTGVISPVATQNGQVAPQSQKQEKAIDTSTKAIAAGEGAVSSIDETNNFIDNLLNNKSLDTIVGNRAYLIPSYLMSEDMGQANSDLESLKSRIVLTVLDNLKRASSTGATGFGALSEKEMKIIQDGIANLSRDQPYKTIVSNLNTIKSALARIKEKASNDISTEKTKMSKSSPQQQQPSSTFDSDLAASGLSKERYEYIKSRQQQ